MRVRTAWKAYEDGQMLAVVPRPSYRLMQGVLHFDSAMKATEAKALEEDRKNAEARDGR